MDGSPADAGKPAKRAHVSLNDNGAAIDYHGIAGSDAREGNEENA